MGALVSFRRILSPNARGEARLIPEKCYHGAGRRRGYFEGWYFKAQNGSETVAFIPALHIDPGGAATASVQVVTDRAAHCAYYPGRAFHADEDRLLVCVGKNHFSGEGCSLDISTCDLSVRGELYFSGVARPSGDIMGPFRFVPGLPCRHAVFSLAHRVEGELQINGRKVAFEDGTGYIEGDRGASFPRRYVWTQCNWGRNSLMLSVADVPILGARIAGVVGFAFVNGHETRIATYCGARVREIGAGRVVVTQGNLTLTVEPLASSYHLLRAPLRGDMTRLIRENAACRVRYVLQREERTLFDITREDASYEDNWR